MLKFIPPFFRTDAPDSADARGVSKSQHQHQHQHPHRRRRDEHRFLAEYAVRKNLFGKDGIEAEDRAAAASSSSSSSSAMSAAAATAMLVREGETVELTEDMFRGELKGTLRKAAAAAAANAER